MLLFIFLTALSGCSAQITFEKQEITIITSSGRINIMAEIAATEEQRSRGLMFREEVNDGEGMLFIFERDQFVSFWMKDTLVPLSIAYIAHNGVILEIFDMEPKDLTPVPSSFPVRYALEVPQNWFSRAGIGPWDRIDTQGLP
jgi:hypothetical protein